MPCRRKLTAALLLLVPQLVVGRYDLPPEDDFMQQAIMPQAITPESYDQAGYGAAGYGAAAGAAGYGQGYYQEQHYGVMNKPRQGRAGAEVRIDNLRRDPNNPNVYKIPVNMRLQIDKSDGGVNEYNVPQSLEVNLDTFLPPDLREKLNKPPEVIEVPGPAPPPKIIYQPYPVPQPPPPMPPIQLPPPPPPPPSFDFDKKKGRKRRVKRKLRKRSNNDGAPIVVPYLQRVEVPVPVEEEADGTAADQHIHIDRGVTGGTKISALFITITVVATLFILVATIVLLLRHRSSTEEIIEETTYG